jgi:prepilin-type N-terminal cleavage/methylation domain-containing protein
MKAIPTLRMRTTGSAPRAGTPLASDLASQPCAGFTLTELVVVSLVIGLCALFVYPALARTRPNGQAFQCLNNLRQLTSAWRSYANDFNDSLVAAESQMPGRANWMAGYLDFSSNQGNWDARAYIMISPLWPYAGSDASIFRCPADPSTVTVNGVRRPRVRTYSMSQVFGLGMWLDKTANPSQTVWRTYAKGSDIVTPARTFVFMEEHPDSINDGAFANACTGAQPIDPPAQAQIIDFPASHHNGAGDLSFADGSAQMHQWQGGKIKPPYGLVLPLNVPAGDSWMDIQWLAQNTTVRR